MDIAPGPSILTSMRNQPLSWKTIIGELIDNSFDADATRIEIEFGKKTLTVSDDGNGCDNIEAMLTLGRHYRQASSRLGRYGVGLKDAACWLWGQLRIETTHKGIKRMAELSWPWLSSQSGWCVPDPEEEPGGAGTQLVFRNYDRSSPDYAALVADISHTFTPGLLQGRQIVFKFPRRKPIVAKPCHLPPFEDSVQAEFCVSGRQVRINIGIVKDGYTNPRPGFSFCHHHRVIRTSSLGADGYSTARVSGEVWLDNGWPLSKNKDDLCDLQDELGAAILGQIKPLLEKAQRQASKLASASFTQNVQSRLNAALSALGGAGKREKRNPVSNHTGTVKPKGTPRRRRRASKTHGVGSLIAKAGQITVEWKPFDQSTMGEVDLPAAKIWLNESNAALVRMRADQNEQAVVSVCSGMLVDETQRTGSVQTYFAGIKSPEGEKFLGLWAEILATMAPDVKVAVGT